MSRSPEAQHGESVDDTRARLLALEMVTVAALNRLMADAPALQEIMGELTEPGALPDRPATGDRAFLDQVQESVAHLAAGITGKL